MAEVIDLDMDVVNSALDGVRRHHPHDLRGCAAVSVSREGEYWVTTSGMTPEQALAAAEFLKNFAMQELSARG